MLDFINTHETFFTLWTMMCIVGAPLVYRIIMNCEKSVYNWKESIVLIALLPVTTIVYVAIGIVAFMLYFNDFLYYVQNKLRS